jgi:hypothetical protein
MTRRSSPREEQLRHAVAQEAARIMAEHGIEDFLLAKRKAAERLMAGNSALPTNAEIEAALLGHQQLFHAERHVQQLHDLRAAALRLMRMLSEFSPHLVGSVLSGSTGGHAEINLHVFTDDVERVALRLEERGIVPHHAQKKLRYEPERVVGYPSFKFVGGQQPFEIVVFPVDGIRQSPSSPVDGKPMARADITAVSDLLK